MSGPSLGGDLCREHFGKFQKEPIPLKRARFLDTEAIRQECVSVFAKLRLLGHKPKNKVRLKRPHKRCASLKNSLKSNRSNPK